MESEFIDWLKSSLGVQTDTRPGIGDDAAVFTASPGKKQLVTSDSLVDRVHFDVASTPLNLIGRKCVAASISDIAAMCGSPTYVIISVVAPKSFSLHDLKDLYEGMITISSSYDCSIVGGDFISHAGPLTINVTVIGESQPQQLRYRYGTEPNDRIFVSGALGGSSHGHHLTFEPRVELGLILGNNPAVHSVTDITDGLLIDLHSILIAGNYGATLIRANIPTCEHLPDEETGIEAALYDGEDFELLFTASSQYAAHMKDVPNNIRITEIGYVTQDTKFVLLDETGIAKPLEIRGYSH